MEKDTSWTSPNAPASINLICKSELSPFVVQAFGFPEEWPKVGDMVLGEWLFIEYY